jgi:hypothetical protein
MQPKDVECCYRYVKAIDNPQISAIMTCRLHLRAFVMHAFQLFELEPSGGFVVHKVHGLFRTFDDATAAAKEIVATSAPFCGYRILELRRKCAARPQWTDRR